MAEKKVSSVFGFPYGIKDNSSMHTKRIGFEIIAVHLLIEYVRAFSKNVQLIETLHEVKSS